MSITRLVLLCVFLGIVRGIAIVRYNTGTCPGPNNQGAIESSFTFMTVADSTLCLPDSQYAVDGQYLLFSATAGVLQYQNCTSTTCASGSCGAVASLSTSSNYCLIGAQGNNIAVVTNGPPDFQTKFNVRVSDATFPGQYTLYSSANYCGQTTGTSFVKYTCDSARYQVTTCTNNVCSQGCTSTISPLDSTHVCTKSKDVGCYTGFSTAASSAGQTTYNGTVDSDEFCASYDFKCTSTSGNTACNAQERTDGTCKHAYTTLTATTCTDFSNSADYFSVSCCDTPNIYCNVGTNAAPSCTAGTNPGGLTLATPTTAGSLGSPTTTTGAASSTGTSTGTAATSSTTQSGAATTNTPATTTPSTTSPSPSSSSTPASTTSPNPSSSTTGNSPSSSAFTLLPSVAILSIAVAALFAQ